MFRPNRRRGGVSPHAAAVNISKLAVAVCPHTPSAAAVNISKPPLHRMCHPSGVVSFGISFFYRPFTPPG